MPLRFDQLYILIGEMVTLHVSCTILSKFVSFNDFLAEYEWNSSESTGAASDYVTDLIAFLRSTFLSFSHLPVSFALKI